MMRELDAMGLEAAIEAAGNVAPTPNWRRDQFAMAIRAYLDAIEPEGEPDRIAVVVNEAGEGMGCTITATTVVDWDVVEDEALGYSAGPFRRQIVRCHLLRPEPVAEAEGAAEDA